MSAELATVDGRVRRGERSRAAIVAAVFALVGEGGLEPTAEQVAKRARVGLRSVFRHFRDMESLYGALDARLRAEVEPIVAEGAPSGGLDARARELAARRARLFERIAPYKRSANLVRAQATFVSDAEVKRVCDFLAERCEPQFNRELTQVCSGALLSEDEKDELYDQAVSIVLDEQRGSASLLQRALEIGYTRASRLLALMRREGIVGAYRGSKASDVLMTMEQYAARRAAAARDAAGEEDAGD